MFSHLFPKPYLEILKLFAAEDWERAEQRGDVQQSIDKTIGKRVFVLRGKLAAGNYLALPAPGGFLEIRFQDARK